MVKAPHRLLTGVPIFSTAEVFTMAVWRDARRLPILLPENYAPVAPAPRGLTREQYWRQRFAQIDLELDAERALERQATPRPATIYPAPLQAPAPPRMAIRPANVERHGIRGLAAPPPALSR